MTQPSWNSEIFLISALDREALVLRCQQLHQQIGSCTFTDLAQLTSFQTDGQSSRIAIVASDGSDLLKKLDRAIERLRSGAEKIQDVSGIYFTENPLGFDANGQPTKLGLMFPGEGSQSLGMLDGLVDHFPGMSEFLGQCDALSAESDGDVASFRQIFEDPEKLSDIDKAELESQLERFDLALVTIFIADWLLYSLFEKLGIKNDTICGHSAGELVALMGSEVLVGSDEQFKNLREGFQQLGREKPENAVQSKLLALGASAEKAEQVLAQVAKDAGRELLAYVAMLNCPHQTVIVGVEEDVQLVEAELLRSKMIYQALELDQPYHTALFEAYMQPLRRMFQEMDFCAPQVPIYSCTTGELFPEDPEEICELTLAHWEKPVRFIELIENQYRDGVRCFIEVGPRNHLTSFTEDILRGKDALVIPMDSPRCRGVESINHLVGQLFVHHFPVNADYLFSVRQDQFTEPEAVLTKANDLLAQQQSVLQTGNREAILQGHFAVMEQFLNLQQEVMNEYLAGGNVTIHQEVSGPTQRSEPTAPRWPLIDEIVQHIPGQSIIARRQMILDEDYFSAQHTVGGRELSVIDPEQYGLPVVPMTFSIEMIAEVAMSLLPSLEVVAMRDIKLFKWLDYDDNDLSGAEVSASVNVELSDSNVAVIEARLFHWNNGEAPNYDRPAVVATIEMAAGFPPAPAARPFQLENERICEVSRSVLYQNLFHGEEFKGVVDFGAFGDNGIEATMEVLPRRRLLSSNTEPNFVFDPVMLDVALHPMCAWHLEQEDQSGRILLPIGVQRLEFFGRRPDVGEQFLSRATISKETTRQFRHEVEIVDAKGNRWCEMQGCDYWRFYLPFRGVNFHGPKNVYRLSEEFNSVSPADTKSETMLLDIPNDLRNPTMQPIGARVTLSDREYEEFKQLDCSDEQQTTWLFGRVALKDAVRTLWFRESGDQLFTADIEIDHDELGKPIASLRGQDTPADFPQVSLSHSGTTMLAIAAMNHAPGIDIEKVVEREESFIKFAYSPAEIELIKSINPEMTEWLTRFWCAKEAVGKSLGCGLVGGPRSVEVVEAKSETGVVKVQLGKRLSGEFPELANAPFVVDTYVKKKFAVAVTIGNSAAVSTNQKSYV